MRRASVELRYSDPSGIVDFYVTGRRTRPGASQRVLSVHWPANVVRSAYRENACSCCVEGTCCEAGRKGPLP